MQVKKIKNKGFSLVEVLVIAVVLLVFFTGVVIWVRSQVQNPVEIQHVDQTVGLLVDQNKTNCDPSANLELGTSFNIQFPSEYSVSNSVVKAKNFSHKVRTWLAMGNGYLYSLSYVCFADNLVLEGEFAKDSDRALYDSMLRFTGNDIELQLLAQRDNPSARSSQKGIEAIYESSKGTEGIIIFVRNSEYLIVSVATGTAVDSSEVETSLDTFFDTFEFLDED